MHGTADDGGAYVGPVSPTCDQRQNGGSDSHPALLRVDWDCRGNGLFAIEGVDSLRWGRSRITGGVGGETTRMEVPYTLPNKEDLSLEVVRRHVARQSAAIGWLFANTARLFAIAQEASEPANMNEQWDVIVVGGGAAGLSAALTLGRACRKVLVIDAGSPRNRFAAHMHGMVGLEGLDPGELLRRGRDEVDAYGVTVRSATVEQVEDVEGGLGVRLSGGAVEFTRALVAATGLADDLPDIPGIREQWGTGVLHCPYCHGWEVRGQRLGVLGTCAMSLHQTELVRQWSDDLTLFTDRLGELSPEAAARLRSRGVTLIDTPVTEILTDRDKLTGVRLADGDRVDLDAVFVSPFLRPHDQFLAGLELKRADNPMGSFIAVDAFGATSHRRIWAIGNVVNPGANVPISIGAGSMTGGVVNMALVVEEFDHAVAAGGGQRAVAGEPAR